MSKKIDDSSVLRHLAGTMDIGKTLAEFPGLTQEYLSNIIVRASEGIEMTVSTKAQLWVDGAARGNPGEAGAGAYMKLPGCEPAGRGEFLGNATNNVAEYKALLLGLEMANNLNIKAVEIYSDSELMIKQMTGEYRVKNEDLKTLFSLAHQAAGCLESVSYSHVPREENVEADRLANMAISARGPITL
ncbi:MAG: ribonuclease HI family protein [bacterium]